MKRSILAALGLLLVPGATFAAPKWPTWAPTTSLDAIRAKYGGEKAVVLNDEWDITVRGGERTGVRRRTVAVLASEGVEAADLVLPRNFFTNFSHVRAWLKRPDGRVAAFDEEDGTLSAAIDRRILDEDEVLWVRAPGVQAGVVVAAEYEFSEKADLPQDLIDVQREIPVALLRVHVDARKGWAVLARVAGGANPGPEEVTVEGVWTFTDVPPVSQSEETNAPAPRAVVLGLNYVSPGGQAVFGDWNGVARWAAALFRQPALSDPGPAIPPSPDVVGAVGRSVREVRYFGLEIGWGGLIPRAPDTVLARGLGDCKDKALLMAVLLQERGVGAVPVLIVSPRHRFVDEALPTPFRFNHAIVGIPWDNEPAPPGAVIAEAPGVGRLRLYDGTLSPASPLDLPVALEGARALVVDERTTGLTEVPVRGADETRLERRVRMTVGPTGDVGVEVTTELAGAFRDNLVTDGGEILSTAELLRDLAAAAGRTCPGYTDLTVDAPQVGDAWTFSHRFSCPQALGEFGGRRALAIPDSRFRSLFFTAERKNAGTIYFPASLTVSETVEVDGGETFEIVAAPGPASVANDLGAVSLAVSRDGRRVILERRATLKAREAPPSRLAELRQLDQGMRRLQGLAVVLKPAVSRSSASSP